MSTRPPELDYKIGSKTYTLTFDLDGFERVEATTGLNLFDDQDWGKVNTSASIAKKIAWSFLHSAHPELELSDIGKVMGIGQVRELTQLLVQGMQAAMPEPEKKDEGAKKADVEDSEGEKDVLPLEKATPQAS